MVPQWCFGMDAMVRRTNSPRSPPMTVMAPSFSKMCRLDDVSTYMNIRRQMVPQWCFGMDAMVRRTSLSMLNRKCRREVTHFKAIHNKDIWPYMVQELKPTLDELGIL